MKYSGHAKKLFIMSTTGIRLELHEYCLFDLISDNTFKNSICVVISNKHMSMLRSNLTKCVT